MPTLKLAVVRSGSKFCTAMPAVISVANTGSASSSAGAHQAPTRRIIASWPPEGGELGGTWLQIAARRQAQHGDATGRHAAEIT